MDSDGDPRTVLLDFVGRNLAGSSQFFSYRTPCEFQFDRGHLTFTSPVITPYAENNRVHADLFPGGNGRRAVVVLPQWNAGAQGHVGLCKLLNRFGVAALRMSLAYHDRRMPAELERADYHVSSNVGRTIHATRQSVLDARCCLDWLQARGYDRLGILGTSLGSCVAFIAAAHDSRICAGVFNHVSPSFADVVWTGLSTQHVRKGLETVVTQDELREYWSVISPGQYLERLVGRNLRSLLVWARYDSSFLPVYSRRVLEQFSRLGLSHEVVSLPCGHYTSGAFPFNLVDGLTMCRFLNRNL